MNWEKYKELSEKTLSSEFYTDGKVEKTLHAVMGICTEMEELLDNFDGTQEFDAVNVSEEIADIFWYLAIIYREYDVEFTSLDKTQDIEDDKAVIDSMNKDSLRLLDIMKKKIFYNREINMNSFKSIILNIFSNSVNLLHNYDIEPSICLNNNIDKLRARYGDKFSSERANNRNLEVERELLESKIKNK